MAIISKDKEDKSVKARLRRAFDSSTLYAYAKGPFVMDFRFKKQEELMGQFLGGLVAVMGLPLYMLVNEPHTRLVEPDTTLNAVFSQNLSENGYVAISQDNGQSGYAVIHEGDNNYNLYEFGNSSLRGHKTLSLVSDNDEAWYTVRSIADNYTNLSDAFENRDVALNAPNWEVFDLGEVSRTIVEDDGDIIRLYSDKTEFDGASIGQTIAQQYETLETSWHNAASAIGTGFTGFDEAALSQIPEVELQNVNPAKDSNFDEIIALIMAGIGGITAFGCSIPATRRRLEYQKDNMRP